MVIVISLIDTVNSSADVRAGIVVEIIRPHASNWQRRTRPSGRPENDNGGRGVRRDPRGSYGESRDVTRVRHRAHSPGTCGRAARRSGPLHG